MRRKEIHFASPQAIKTARHLAGLVKQARIARGWSQAELAERARVSTPTMQRLEKGGEAASLGIWLAVFEQLGLLSRLTDLRDSPSEALLDATRAKRSSRKRSVSDLDF